MNFVIGRWQKGKDLLWYTRSSSSDNGKELEEERARIRELDEERLNAALGMKSRREEEKNGPTAGAGSSKKKTHSLDDSELKQLLSRGSTERSALDGERVAGLGAAPTFIHDHLTRISAIQAEINRLKKESSAPLNSEDRDSKKRKRDNNDDGGSGGSSSDSDDSDSSSSDSDSSDSGDIKVSEKLSKKNSSSSSSSSNSHSNKDDDGGRHSSKKSKRHKKEKNKHKSDKKEKKDKKKKHKKERKHKSSKDK